MFCPKRYFLPVIAFLWASFTQAQEPPTLTIMEPTEGQTIYSQTFTLLVDTSGDTASARFDHIHWQLSGGPNLTAADNSGVIEVIAPTDGDYTITSYMATPEHVVIDQKKTVHFKVVTTGVTLLAPTASAVLTTSDPIVYYSFYGSTPGAAVIHSTLDNADATTDDDLDGVIALHGLSEGSHQFTMWLTDMSNILIGEVVERQFEVRSALNTANLKKAIGYVNSSASKNARSAKSSLSKLKSLLTSMQAGGSSSTQNPNLTSDKIAKAQKLLASAQRAKGSTATKRLKSLKTLLAKMLPPA